MFQYFTSLQYVTFVLGIVASVFAVAGIFIAFKHASKLKSLFEIVLLVVFFPFVAICAWLMLIFSYIPAFAADLTLNIVISIAISVVVYLVITIVAASLYKKHKVQLESKTQE